MIGYFSFALLILTLMYSAFIFWCIVGWRKLKTNHSQAKNFTTMISVIVCARNEEKNISGCLESLLIQKYPHHLLEIIVVDDHSTDRTVGIIESILQKSSTPKIMVVKNVEKKKRMGYKKQAITTAIRKSRGELIITTDADCRMLENWLPAIVSYYETERPDMISGPVCFDEEKNSFEKLQSLEFMGLIGIGAGAISNHQPMMCNGANLAYTKKIFMEVNGFEESSETASGDDTQLMLKIAKVNSSKIHFLKSADAVVYTSAMNSADDLLQQRKRWASKIPAKMSLFVLLTGCVAYLLHLGLFILLSGCLVHATILPLFLFFFSLKIIPEFILIYSVSVFFRRKNLLWLFFPAQFIYMIYISFIGAIAPFGSYHWKGRSIKPERVKFTS